MYYITVVNSETFCSIGSFIPRSSFESTGSNTNRNAESDINRVSALHWVLRSFNVHYFGPIDWPFEVTEFAVIILLLASLV